VRMDTPIFLVIKPRWSGPFRFLPPVVLMYRFVTPLPILAQRGFLLIATLLSLAGTVGWSNWNTEARVISLSEGIHTFEVDDSTQRSWGPNVDWVSVRLVVPNRSSLYQETPHQAVKMSSSYGGATNSQFRLDNDRRAQRSAKVLSSK
jgi:hypothetical protein